MTWTDDDSRPSGAVAGVRSVKMPVTWGRMEPGTAARVGLSGSSSMPVNSATITPVSARTCSSPHAESRRSSNGTESSVRLRTATSMAGSPAAETDRCTTRPSEIRPGASAGSVEKTTVFSGTSASASHGAVMVRSSGLPETSGEVTDW